MFSKACEYAIRACIFICGQTEYGFKSSLVNIAYAIDSPEAYTSKILQRLTKAEIIISEKGPQGGFTIKMKDGVAPSLALIVEAIDGDAIYKGCGLGLKNCSAKKPCPIHNQFMEIREKLFIMLTETPVSTLSMEHVNGLTFLKR